MNSKIKHLIGLGTLAIALSGCATARLVSQQPGKGGVIAVIPTGNAEARQKAQVIMDANCGSKKSEITEEGEVVIGTTSNSSGNTSLYGKKSIGTSTTTNTTQQTEWRLTYKCI